MVFKQISKVMKNKTETNSLQGKSYKESFCISTKTLSLFDLRPESQSQPFPSNEPRYPSLDLVCSCHSSPSRWNMLRCPFHSLELS